MAAACNRAARDQWGNVVSGIELGRRMGEAQLFGLTTPLITTASGAKMGKTAAGAVWLNKDMLSVYDYWQFWRNTEDGDVGRFLRLFTDLPEGEIARLETLAGRGAERRQESAGDRSHRHPARPRGGGRSRRHRAPRLRGRRVWPKDLPTISAKLPKESSISPLRRGWRRPIPKRAN